MAEETKIVYYIGDEQTPYVSKINIPPSVITLGDFKEAIKKPNHKYFFRSKDAEFGVVKEEITNDQSHLPLCEGRIVGWLVAPDVDNFSQDSGSVNSLPQQPPPVVTGNEPRPQAFLRNGMGPRDSDTESIISHHRPPHRLYDRYGGSQSTLMSSDLSTTSWDSREDTMSEYSTCTDMTASSRHHKQRLKKKYKKKRPRPGSDTTSNYSSSVTDSSMSLNIVVVTLNMEKYRFLGISIVGQSNDKGDGGIYIGSIMKGGAVAADGRIEPGDMLLQVNDKNFENMSNEEAVRVLRNIVHDPGPIHLTVAKCWDPTPESMFIIPKDEPVRPIDPAAWANHTMAVRDQYGDYPGPSPSYGGNLEASSDTLANSLPESERYDMPLSIRTTMAVVVKHLKMPDSGLDVKTRMWLKITIPNAFIGSDLVEWLHQKVEGLQERRDARKYASNLLKAGYIRHTVNKITFSEQCYYVFGDHTVPMHQDMANLSLGDSNSDRDSDVLGPLPMTNNKLPWGVPGGSSHGYPSYNNQQQSYHPYNPSPQLGRPGGDFVAPPPAYSCISGQSGDNFDVASIHSANGMMMHRTPSELSLTRQHLATFDAGSGSGSDNLSESRYSSRSGRSGGSNHRTQRSHSGSEKDTQSQMSFNMGGSNSGSLHRRHKNQGSMTLDRPRPPLPLPRSSSQRSSNSDHIPVNPYHPSMQNVNPPGVLPSSSHHGSRNHLPPNNNQMNGPSHQPVNMTNNQMLRPHPNQIPNNGPNNINQMQRPNTNQVPHNGQNTINQMQRPNPNPVPHNGQNPNNQAPLNNHQGRPLNAVPQNLTNSQQSFQQAMGNPCDYFVGVM